MANEKRLIDANALMAEHCESCAEDIKAECKTNPICGSMMWIVDAPTVDAVEVKHGRWIMPKESYSVICSVCGGSCWYYDYGQTIGESNYCPNCGAKMDGGNEDGNL